MVAHAYYRMKIGALMDDAVLVMVWTNYPISIYCAVAGRCDLTFPVKPTNIRGKVMNENFT